MKNAPLLLIISAIVYFNIKKSQPTIMNESIKTPQIDNSPIWKIPESGKSYANLFTLTSIKYELPENLLARMGWQESRFRTDIITGKTSSSAGAQGIMQIVPRWHPDVDPLNPVEAVPYAGQYVKKLYDRFGTWDKALAGYNYGPTAVSRLIKNHGDNWAAFLPTETKNYIKEILLDVRV